MVVYELEQRVLRLHRQPFLALFIEVVYVQILGDLCNRQNERVEIHPVEPNDLLFLHLLLDFTIET